MAHYPDPCEGQYLGRVEESDAESAIERAIAEFGIDEAHRSRLIGQPFIPPLSEIAQTAVAVPMVAPRFHRT